jgi:hypothetical protein
LELDILPHAISPWGRIRAHCRAAKYYVIKSTYMPARIIKYSAAIPASASATTITTGRRQGRDEQDQLHMLGHHASSAVNPSRTETRL